MKEFFKQLSAENHYMDEKCVMEMYYSLLRLILKELKSNGSIELPDWGEFRVITYKPRKIRNIITRLQQIVPETKMIKFSSAKKLKLYVKNIP